MGYQGTPMRTPTKAYRIRIPIVAACVLLSGSALAATATPAYATPARDGSAPAAAAHTITVTNPGARTTNPLSAPVDLAIKAVDSDKSATLTYSATGLPPGLAISKTTGVITGTVTTADKATVKVTATDATKASGSASFTWTAANTIAITPPKPQATAVGTAVAVAVPAEDDDTKATPLKWTATGLPPGLAINGEDGVITGTPTTGGAYSVKVTVTDATKSAASATFSWRIADQITVTAPAKLFWEGIPVIAHIKATDSDLAQKLTYTATGLPAGLSISPTAGVISGRTTTVTSGTATVTATDGAGSAGTASFAWKVSLPIIIPDPGTVQNSAGQTLTVPLSFTDAIGPLDHVTLAALGLPRGVTFEQSPPTIFGWVPAPGTYRVTIAAKGSLGDTSAMTFAIIVKPAPDLGPTGQIGLDLGGKCLDDLGNIAANGTKVVLWSCQPGPAQRWTLAADGTIRIHGTCLDVAGYGGYLGQGVRLWPCVEGAARETWAAGAAGELVNAASGLCLGDDGASTKNGKVPTLVACRVTNAQVWTLPAERILSAQPGRCVDDLHSAGANGNVVDTYSCNGTPSQGWTVATDFTLRMFGDKCATVAGPYGKPGTRIELWTCTRGDKEQKWTVVRDGTLGSELVVGGVCLAAPSMTAPATTQLVTAACSVSDPRVNWHIW